MKTSGVLDATALVRFELNCPTATASVLSKQMIQSEIVNPRWHHRSVPNIRSASQGVTKRATYLVVCVEGGTGCVSAGAQHVVQH
jgi:hypothetical protein